MRQQFVELYEYYDLEKPAYATGTLTCWLQEDPVGSGRRLRPAALIVPGGGYGHVSKREGTPVALRFLARGWNVFVLEYSVAPLRFPVQLREVAMAMGYIRCNAATMGVDPAMVAAVGFSAGGHLCGMLGTLFDAPEVADIAPGAMLRPDALGLCYPVAVSWGKTHEGSFDNLCGEDRALRQRLSLDALARADMPPVFLWHTRDDQSVPCRNSLLLAAALEEKGVEFALHLYRHGPHGLSTADAQAYPDGALPQISPDILQWPEKMMDFFRETGLKTRDLEENA